MIPMPIFQQWGKERARRETTAGEKGDIVCGEN